MRRRSCLVHVFGSGNVLAALSAVKRYGLQDPGERPVDVVTLVHTPGLPDPVARKSGAVVERLVLSQPWRKPLVLTDGEMAEVNGRGGWISYREVLRCFREKMGRDHFDEVYYAHDLVGDVPELAMNAYPNATRITYGDALGSVYDKDYHLALAGGRQRGFNGWKERVRTSLGPQRMLLKLKRTLKKGILGGPFALKADRAVLILPMDQTGHCLDDKELLIVPRDLVSGIISDCQKSVPELADYSRRLLACVPPPYFLVLLENLSDGNFVAFDREVALYEEIVRRHVPLGGTVLIKAHPLSIARVDEVLRARLTPDYVTQRLSDELNRYPMELWSELIRACQVITMSYCSISLTFLYGKRVIYPMDSSLIEKYIPVKFWDSYKNADSLYQGQLTNLAVWDGKRVLWRGSIS